MDRFPEGGPPILWKADVAGGYSGPAVGDGRVFVTDYVTKEDVKVDNFQRKTFTGVERVLCLRESDGVQLWKHEYPVTYSISYPAGPRCTPNIDGDRVYTLGAEGHLFCFAADNGKVIWSKHLTDDYKTKAALWGYASHPLIDGDKFICLVGGEGSHVVAFDKMTGKELWRSLTATEQGYSPPKIIEAGGVRQMILARPDGVSSIDPDTGKEYWTTPYDATSGSIIMTPIRWKDYLYIGGYSNKNLLLKLAADRPAVEVVWRNESRKGVSPVNVQPFLLDDTIYGIDQSGKFFAVELPTGKRLWETTQPLGDRPVGSGTAFIIRQGDRFWMFAETGELLIAKCSLQGLQVVDRAKVIEPSNNAFGRPVVWSAPAFANRRIYLRNDNQCICVDASAAK